MNKVRRKTINEIIEQLDSLKDEIQAVLEEEEEYRDNIPENMQGGEQYEQAETACENLDSALSSLEEVTDYLASARDGE